MEAALNLTEAAALQFSVKEKPWISSASFHKFWLGGDTLGIVQDLRVSKQHDCFNTHANEIAATCASNFNILVFEFPQIEICGQKTVFKHEDADSNWDVPKAQFDE